MILASSLESDRDTLANPTLITAVVGIGVSGVVGPMATAWATRRANRQQFERDQAARRRDDLRGLVDEAGKLLGAGATNLRVAREAAARGQDEPSAVGDWARTVHLIEQRLLLRLPADDPVMSAYESVLTALEAVGSAAVDGERSAIENFESANDAFLDTARAALQAPIAATTKG